MYRRHSWQENDNNRVQSSNREFPVDEFPKVVPHIPIYHRDGQRNDILEFFPLYFKAFWNLPNQIPIAGSSASELIIIKLKNNNELDVGRVELFTHSLTAHSINHSLSRSLTHSLSLTHTHSPTPTLSLAHLLTHTHTHTQYSLYLLAFSIGSLFLWSKFQYLMYRYSGVLTATCIDSSILPRFLGPYSRLEANQVAWKLQS